METFLGILIPFLGTTLGSACVFFLRRGFKDKVQRALIGFASGVMVAASIWSLIIPAIEQSSSMGKWACIPAFVGFWLGILFLFILDKITPHFHTQSNTEEGPKNPLKKTTKMLLAEPFTIYLKEWLSVLF